MHNASAVQEGQLVLGGRLVAPPGVYLLSAPSRFLIVPISCCNSVLFCPDCPGYVFYFYNCTVTTSTRDAIEKFRKKGEELCLLRGINEAADWLTRSGTWDWLV